MAVDHLLELLVELLALGEEVVQLDLSEDRPQRRLRQLGGGVHVVLDLDDRLDRPHGAEVHHGVHFHRDVVAGDDVLRRDVQHHRPQAHLDEPLNRPQDEDDARTLWVRIDPAEGEHDAPLVLVEDVDPLEDQDHDHEDRDDDTEGDLWHKPP